MNLATINLNSTQLFAIHTTHITKMINSTLAQLNIQELLDQGEASTVFEHIHTFEDFDHVDRTIADAASCAHVHLCTEFPEFHLQSIGEE